MGTKVLPDELFPEVVRLQASMSPEKIVAWLFTTHNITISATALRKRLAHVNAERKVITNQILTDKLSRTVGLDLDEVGAAITRALEDEILARQAADEMTTPEGGTPVDARRVHMHGSDSWSRIMQVVSKSRNDLMKLLSLRLELAGASKDEKPKADTIQVRDELMAKVDKLLAKARGPSSTPTAH